MQNHSLPPPYEWSFRRVMGATLILTLVALSFWLLYRFYLVIFILFVAIMLGTVIRPLVTWLHQRRLPRPAGVILVYCLLLASLLGFVFLLFPLIIEQGASMLAATPGYYQALRQWTLYSLDPLLVRLGGFLPTVLPGMGPNPQTGVEVMASAGQAAGYVVVASRVIFITLVILVLAFHWTLNGRRIVQSLLPLAPKEQRESINELIVAMETKVGFYIAGQGVLCLIIGVLALVAYLLIGLPNALLLALVAGVLEAIPMIGPLLGALPAAVVALSISPVKMVWVIVATLVIQQAENSLLVPRVMRKAVGVNPFVSLLAIFAFSSFFGVAGALMAIPMAAILQLLLNRFVFYPLEAGADSSSGRDYVSRLRYLTQDLAQDLRKQARLKKWGSDHQVKQIDQVMDEIETITTDLDTLLAQVPPAATP